MMNCVDDDITEASYPANAEPAQHSLMVVEDNDGLRELFTRVFQRQSYNVHSAMNGQLAITLLANPSFVPKVILLDIDMPLVNGFSVMKFVRMQDHLRDTKIIVVTGNDSTAFSSHVELADLWLLKPVSVVELVMLVKRFAN